MNNINRTPPTKEGALENKQANTNRLKLSPTERRIVRLLIESPKISSDLEQLACCRYAADNIQHIRQKGIKIITEMVPYKRKDGKRVQMGL